MNNPRGQVPLPYSMLEDLYWRVISRMLRFFFYLLYQPMAWSYDFVAAAVSLGRWKTWVLSVVEDLPGPVVLEVGHGPGHLLVALRAKGVRVVGLDRSWPMSSLAYRRLRRSFDEAGIFNGYAQFMPFADRSFDQVVATFPAEYLWQVESLHEIHRVLQPGGKLVILPAAWITGNSIPDRLAAGLFRITGQAPDLVAASITDRLTQPLKAAGFQPSVQTRPLTSSLVQVITAQKLPGS